VWGCQGEIFKVKTSWIIGLWMLFIGGALLSGILEMQYLGGSEDVSGVFNRMMSVPSLSNLNFLEVAGAVIGIIWDWVQAFWDMLWWDYAFFHDNWAIFKWMLCYPLSIAMVVSTVMAIGRGVGSR